MKIHPLNYRDGPPNHPDVYFCFMFRQTQICLINYDHMVHILLTLLRSLVVLSLFPRLFHA